MATSIETQLRKAQEMRTTVQNFSQKLILRMDEFKSTLEGYVRAGFPEDVAEMYLGRYYTPSRALVDDLSKDMRERHVDFLDRIIAGLESILARE